MISHRPDFFPAYVSWLLVAACAPAVAPQAPTTSLRLRGSPPDAIVVVDEQTLGTLDYVQAHGVAMPPGVHRITVKASNYFPWDRQVEAKPGSSPVTLDVSLTPIPD
ncbi:MAG: PEGA domain-containing protein [Polyangiaceae bacterium]|jgi:hypothetical protein